MAYCWLVQPLQGHNLEKPGSSKTTVKVCYDIPLWQEINYFPVIIMNVRNELYTALSSLSRQTYLMLTELSADVIAFNTTFQIQNSPSHTVNVHGCCTIDFAYRMSLINTFQILITENYNFFILIIGCILLWIFKLEQIVSFKMFDSRAMDSFGIAILKKLV